MADNMDLQISITGQNETGSSFNSLDSAMSELQKLAEDVSKSFSDFARAISSSFTDAGRSAEELMRPLSEIRTDASGINELTSSIRELTTQLQGAAREATNMNQAINHSGHGNSGHGGRAEALFGSEMQNNAMYAGMSMGAAALPLVGAIKASTDAYGQFSQAMANVNSMMGLSQPQLQKMSDQVLALSKDVPDGPVALANALYGIVGAGVPAADQMAVLATASKAATAGQTDVSTATNALIAVMNSYGLKGKDVAAISDQMFAANAAGAMTFTQFANSIGSVAGPAAQAGVSFKEVGAATAALTNQGMSAQRATQGLRALLVGIMSPTAGATKEAKKLGIEWDQNALKSKGMANMLKEAMTATHGNSQELKKLIPNIAAWTVAVDLGGKGADSFKQAMQTMAGSAGATDKAMEEQKQGFTEQMNEMKNSLQSAEIAFAKGFIPVLTDVAGKLAKVAEWFSNLSPSTQKLIGEVTIGAAVFLTLGSAFFMTISAIGALVTGFQGLATALKVVTGAETLMEALNPVGWVILIVAAIVTVSVLIYQHWGQIKQFLQQTWTNISNTAKSIWSTLSTSIGNFVSETITTIKNIWNGAISWISSAAQDFVNIPVAAFEWLYNHNYYFKDLVDLIKARWQQALNDATSIWRTLTNTLSSLWSGTVSLAKSVWSTLASFFSGLWSGISSGVSGAWNSITGSVSNGTNSAINAIKGPFNSLGSFFSGLWNQAEQWGANLVNMIGQGIKNAASSVGSAVSGVANTIKSMLGFHSPAETGPASDADVWMPNLMKMFTNDIQRYTPQFQAAISSVAVGMKAGFTSPITNHISQSMALPGGSNGAVVYNITVNANGNVTRNERELGDVVSRAILNKVKMQGRI